MLQVTQRPGNWQHQVPLKVGVQLGVKTGDFTESGNKEPFGPGVPWCSLPQFSQSSNAPFLQSPGIHSLEALRS